jgi:hypothetical protein
VSTIPFDGTVLTGAGAYAYVTASGQRRAVPDATTLRDLGHRLAGAQALAPADLAAIPLGTPYASTSKFTNPPSAQIPLVLLPVRVETAFSNNELLVRIFPDTVHFNSFEAALTDDEASARAQYLAIVASDTAGRKAAFGALVRQFGTARAAYVASDDATSATKDADWTIAPFTNVLPERWIVLGYTALAGSQVLAIGNPIVDSLAVGPAPNGTGPSTDPGIAWLRDFDAAVAAGMGMKVTIPAVSAGYERLVVLGLRSTLSASDASARFASLLQAHHYSDGIALLPRDAATNNTETTPSAYSTADPDFDALFAVEQGAALCPNRPTGDGDRLARALGVVPTTFAHVSGADGGEDEQAAAMNAALWPATWGYYLEQLVTGAVPNPTTTLPAVRDHFAAHVRARGHYPALMLGRQPYGVLPVCWSAQYVAQQPADPVQTQLEPLLAKLRATWEQSVANVPSLNGASDAEAALVAVLGMTPSSVSYASRATIGPEYAFTFYNFAKADLNATWWSNLATKTAAAAAPVGPSLAATRLASATYSMQSRGLGSELVADSPLEGQAAPAYVAQLAAMGWQALRDATPPALPATLFFYLLRFTALRAYVDAAFDLLIAANAAQPADRLEAELVGFDVTRPDAWSVLSRTLPGRAVGSVGAVLDGRKNDPSLPAFAAFWKAFGTLASFSASDLDAALREVFDLASYRLDSWITSLAQSRLESTRAANPNAGVVIGGYGWVENVRPATATASASSGFLHAPSVDRATSAAVLRSGYLAHAGDAGRPFAIDLSSQRVRLGLHLLEGMRTGQSLGALLGYRFERSLHEAEMDQFIDAFRNAAPSDDANALDVVDGLALVRAFQTSATFWNAAGLPASGTAERTATTKALQTLADALDATADLALAESVHQLTRGNTLRAGATLDAIARGDAPPPNIDFVNTPRSGIASTYRVLSLALDTTATGWAPTTRATAEPRLNAWAGTLLGDPSRVRLRVSFAAATPVTVEFGFNELNLAPLDVLALPEASNGGPELAGRIIAAGNAHRPAGVAVDAAASLITDRDPAWNAETIGLPEWLVLARTVARAVNGARALTPADFAGPNDTPVAVDTAELQARADGAESHLRATTTALAQSPAAAATLLDATSFGARANDELADLSARTAALDALASGFDGATASADEQVTHDVARLQATFGASFVVLPAFVATATAPIGQLWANSDSLQGGDAFASARFLQRAARVRTGVRRMSDAMLLAESLAGSPFPLPAVAQLAAVTGDRWGGLDTAPGPSSSTLSLVAWTSPETPAAGALIAGLAIDEWIDVVPSTSQTTGVAFDYSAPTGRAPQAILLAVGPDLFPEWTLESLEGSVLEALDLAKIRGVDPDALGALGHYLPALYFPYNATTTTPDVPSIDLSAIRVVDREVLD